MTNIQTEKSNQRFPAIAETEEDLCRALWLSVALQAIIDASSKSRKKTANRDKSQALSWLSDPLEDESDLAYVCELAGIDYRRLRKRFRKIMSGEVESVDFRCLKKLVNEEAKPENRKRYFARARKNARLRQERVAIQAEFDKQILVISAFCELQDTPEIEAKRAS